MAQRFTLEADFNGDEKKKRSDKSTKLELPNFNSNETEFFIDSDIDEETNEGAASTPKKSVDKTLSEITNSKDEGESEEITKKYLVKCARKGDEETLYFAERTVNQRNEAREAVLKLSQAKETQRKNLKKETFAVYEAYQKKCEQSQQLENQLNNERAEKKKLQEQNQKLKKENEKLKSQRNLQTEHWREMYTKLQSDHRKLEDLGLHLFTLLQKNNIPVPEILQRESLKMAARIEFNRSMLPVSITPKDEINLQKEFSMETAPLPSSVPDSVPGENQNPQEIQEKIEELKKLEIYHKNAIAQAQRSSTEYEQRKNELEQLKISYKNGIAQAQRSQDEYEQRKNESEELIREVLNLRSGIEKDLRFIENKQKQLSRAQNEVNQIWQSNQTLQKEKENLTQTIKLWQTKCQYFTEKILIMEQQLRSFEQNFGISMQAPISPQAGMSGFPPNIGNTYPASRHAEEYPYNPHNPHNPPSSPGSPGGYQIPEQFLSGYPFPPTAPPINPPENLTGAAQDLFTKIARLREKFKNIE